MKNLFKSLLPLIGFLLLQSCTKTESDFSEAPEETISVNASTNNVIVGSTVRFSILSSTNNTVTTQSKIYVNGGLITGDSYTFTTEGNFAVYAIKGSLTSKVITINVIAASTSTGYKHRVLVEEYSGTWCGNCPRILYAVSLLEQQTEKAVVVSTHLYNGDPFISSDGNNLASSQGVTSVPTGFINRTTNWSGPQYENVPQVINTIQAVAPAGLAIGSTNSNNNLSINVKVGYMQPITGVAKLTVYLVEDKLYSTQRNYSSNLYGGQASIPNFEYNGVLRKVVSAISGDVIPSSGNTNEKNYSFSIPPNISNIANAKIVAFITNAAGAVINVQTVKVGEQKAFEFL